MSRFHITEDGPKKCTAQPGNCPITQEDGSPVVHFSNMSDAQKSFEEQMESSGMLFKNSDNMDDDFVVPPKPSISAPSDEEVSELFERFRKQGQSSKVSEILGSNIAGYGLTGSSVYGLQVPGSDRDIVIVTDSFRNSNLHHVFDDGEDIRIQSMESFSKNVMEGSPQEVDLFNSGKFIMKDESLHPYLSSLRFSSLSYLDKSQRHSLSQIGMAFSSGDEKKRSKQLKTVLRNCVMERRVYENNGRVRTLFSNDERRRFFETLSEMKPMVEQEQSERDPLIRKIKEAPKNPANKILREYLNERDKVFLFRIFEISKKIDS